MQGFHGLSQGSECGADRLDDIRRSCRAPRSAAAADRQILFTLYNHPRPDFPGFPAHSPFFGHELPERIQVPMTEPVLFRFRRLAAMLPTHVMLVRMQTLPAWASQQIRVDLREYRCNQSIMLCAVSGARYSSQCTTWRLGAQQH